MLTGINTIIIATITIATAFHIITTITTYNVPSIGGTFTSSHGFDGLFGHYETIFVANMTYYCLFTLTLDYQLKKVTNPEINKITLCCVRQQNLHLS